jgi:excisionase family DNA binding protein
MAGTYPVLLLTSEVAQILQVSEATVRLWEQHGRLSAVKTERGVRIFNRCDVERLARERRSAAESGGLVATGAA